MIDFKDEKLLQFNVLTSMEFALDGKYNCNVKRCARKKGDKHLILKYILVVSL